MSWPPYSSGEQSFSIVNFDVASACHLRWTNSLPTTNVGTTVEIIIDSIIADVLFNLQFRRWIAYGFYKTITPACRRQLIRLPLKGVLLHVSSHVRSRMSDCMTRRQTPIHFQLSWRKALLISSQYFWSTCFINHWTLMSFLSAFENIVPSCRPHVIISTNIQSSSRLEAAWASGREASHVIFRKRSVTLSKSLWLPAWAIDGSCHHCVFYRTAQLGQSRDTVTVALLDQPSLLTWMTKISS